MVRNSVSEPKNSIEDHDDPGERRPAVLFDESPDRRLTAGKLPDVTVHVTCRDRAVVKCAVRAIGSQELVLIVPRASGQPTAGDLVTFSLWERGRLLLTEQSGIAHWFRTEGENSIVALFSGNRLDMLLDDRLIDERRMDIRYPVDLRALIAAGEDQREARIVNYSLHGLCLVSDTDLELNRHYDTNVICDEGNLRLAAAPQWTSRITDGHLIGCALTPQYGMLLTCRHASNSITHNSGPAALSCPSGNVSSAVSAADYSCQDNGSSRKKPLNSS
jgi:hypothetical protein